MKLKTYLLILGITSGFLFTSCDDPKDEFSSTSPEAIEADKVYMETQGQEVLQNVKDMEQQPAIETNDALVYFLDNGEPPFKSIDITTIDYFKPIFALSSLKDNNVKCVFNSLKSSNEEPETIGSVYDSLVGVYTWNFDEQGWDYEQTGSNITFYFPSTETGTANNASYVITYTGTPETYTFEDIESDLPKTIDAKLTVDNTVILTYVFEGSYQSDGLPISINTSLTLGEYAFTLEFANTDSKKLKASYAWTKGSQIIMKFELGVDGNWSTDSIENSEYFQDVVSSGNASFQVLGVKAVGEVDVVNLENVINDLDEQETETFEEDSLLAIQAIDALNKYVKLSLRNSDNNKIMAKLEAYPVVVEEEYYDWVYNGEELEYVLVQDKYIDLGLRFVFGDGSKIDAETYFENGFDDLINDLEGYYDDMIDKYGI